MSGKREVSGIQDTVLGYIRSLAPNKQIDLGHKLIADLGMEAALNDVLRSYERQLRHFGLLQRAGTTVTRMDGSRQELTVGGLVAATHREGIGTVVNYFSHRDRNQPRPPALPTNQRGDLSRFNQVEARLAEFAAVPYQRVLP